jgi:hypothetical protein
MRRWAMRVTRIGKKKCLQSLVGHSEGSIPAKVISVYGMVILKWILKKYDGKS